MSGIDSRLEFSNFFLFSGRQSGIRTHHMGQGRGFESHSRHIFALSASFLEGQGLCEDEERSSQFYGHFLHKGFLFGTVI